MNRNGWVILSRNPDYIEVNLNTGQVAEYGRVVAGNPEYLVLGQLSEEAKLALRAAIDDAKKGEA